MRDEKFEWDDRKAGANLRKHGIAFDLARFAFDDTNAVEDLDDDIDEERVKLTGMANGRLLVIIYTMRDPRIRIVSARKANPDEELRYFRLGA